MTNPMSEVTAVTLDDIPCIKAQLSCAGYEESNHNLINLYMWQNWYPLWKYEADHYLLLIGKHEGQVFMYMPLCAQQYFTEALHKARQLFEQAGIPFVMSCFTESYKDLALACFPDLVAHAHRDSFDYVYAADKLRTLSGKKLQKRRNHYNAFVKLYASQATFEDMNAKNAQECLPFLTQWRDSETDPFLQEEKKGTAFILSHYALFDATGGILRIDGAIKGFIIASALTRRMVQINIEKADPEVRGSYQALEKEFLNRHFTQAELVNKEDDVGDPDLRHAKMAYSPVDLIAKYWIEKG